VECYKAALAGLSSDFRERRRFPITPRAIGQRDSQKDVLCNRSCAGGDDEGVRNGDIDGPVLNSCDRGWEMANHCAYTASVLRSSDLAEFRLLIFQQPASADGGLAEFGESSGLSAAVPMCRARNEWLFPLASSRFGNSCRECTPADRVSPRSGINTLAGTGRSG